MPNGGYFDQATRPVEKSHIKQYTYSKNGQQVTVKDHDDKRQAAQANVPHAQAPAAAKGPAAPKSFAHTVQGSFSNKESLGHKATIGKNHRAVKASKRAYRASKYAEAAKTSSAHIEASNLHGKAEKTHSASQVAHAEGTPHHEAHGHFAEKHLEAQDLHKQEAERIATESKQVFDNFEEALKAYAAHPESKGGKHLDVDEARELVYGYRKNRGMGAGIVHEDASGFIKKAYAKRMAEPIKSSNEVVTFLAGGGGSGKGTAGKKFGVGAAAHTVVDGVFSNFDKAKTQIDMALNSGRAAELCYVWAPIEKAVKQAVGRAHNMHEREGSGRMVPISALAEGHHGAQKAIAKLIEHYKDDPRVSIKILDNEGGLEQANIMDLHADGADKMLGFLKSKEYGNDVAERATRAYYQKEKEGHDGKAINQHVKDSFRASIPEGYEHLEHEGYGQDPAVSGVDKGNGDGPKREAPGTPEGGGRTAPKRRAA